MFNKTNFSLIAIIINIIFIFGGAIILFFLMIESFFYQGVIKNNFNINIYQYLILFIFCSILMRLFFPLKKLKQITSIWLIKCMPFFSFLAIFLDFSNDLFYPNFSFSNFHIHPIPFYILILSINILSLIYADWTYLKLKSKNFIFSLGWFFFSTIALFKSLYMPTYFHTLRKEDGFFEYLTAIGFFVSSIFMILIAKQLRLIKSFKWRKLLIFYTTLVSLGLFVVSGEEVSWGQRILNFETPNFIAENNTQGELTLHNQKDVLEYVYFAYFIIALYGLVSPFLKSLIIKLKHLDPNKLKVIDFVMPDYYLIPYFIPTFYYTSYRLTIGWSYYGIGQWEETTEMFLGFGALLFSYFLYKKVKNKNSIYTTQK